MATILINSILGGQAPTTYFAQKDQFRASLGIDPAQPIDDADSVYSTVASGLLRPVPVSNVSGTTTITSAPLWMKSNPKNGYAYIYDANGSAYSIDTSSTVTALSDAGTLSSSQGNGLEYYDNYMYFATGTDITRYGPLDGSPGFVQNYWTSTLGKTALTNTTYPASFKNKIRYPNHVMCRHSDGKLYIADVVGNLGTIHYIATTKTTVEGDTNNNSTANKLTFGYGLWPTAIESYGQYLAIALVEVSSTNKRDSRAKMALWDTTSASFNQIVWVEFPDPLITALKNVNGVLYVVSGGYNAKGFRVSRYLGGYSFKEVFYSETGEPSFPGAVEGINNRFLAGTFTTIPENDGCVYSIGLQKDGISSGVFNTMRASGGTSSTSVTSLMVFSNGASTPIDLGFYTPTIGWTQAGDGSTGVYHSIDQQQTTYSNAPSMWWSQTYKIGQRFSIKRIRIPLAQALSSNMTVTPKIYFDDGAYSQTLPAINTATMDSGKRVYNTRVDNTGSNIYHGEHNFWIELKWTGSAVATVALPIQIDFEVIGE